MHRSKKLEASIYSICCCYNKTKLLGTNYVLATSSNCWPICSIGSVMKTPMKISETVPEAQSAASAWAKPDVVCLSCKAWCSMSLLYTAGQDTAGVHCSDLISTAKQMLLWRNVLLNHHRRKVILYFTYKCADTSVKRWEQTVYIRPSPHVWSLLFFISDRNALLLPHFVMFPVINGITKNIQEIVSLYCSNLELVPKLTPVLAHSLVVESLSSTHEALCPIPKLCKETKQQNSFSI